MKKDSAQEVTDSVSYLLEANSMKVPTSLTNPLSSLSADLLWPLSQASHRKREVLGTSSCKLYNGIGVKGLINSKLPLPDTTT